MRITTYLTLFIGLCLTIVGLSCSSTDAKSQGASDGTLPVGPSPSQSANQPRSGPRALDLSTSLESAALAFQRKGGQLSGGGETYRVKVEGARFALTSSGTHQSVSVETVELGRDGAMLSLASRGDLDADGSVKLRHGAVVERLQNTPEGVSQSWEIPRLPGGGGDFIVRVEVKGQAYVGETEGGLHFRGAAPGPGLRYGHATWITAEGSRSAIFVRFVSGVIEIRVPQSLVESSTYPVLLDPIVGPEFAVDQPFLLDGSRPASRPAVATDANGGSLVVWESNQKIYGARLDAQGNVLDPYSLPISTAFSLQGAPSVAFNGTHYLVVWHVLRSGSMSICGARVSPDGTILDPGSILISDAAYTEDFARVASDGTDFLVVWQDGRHDNSNLSIYGARVLADGTVPDTDGISIHYDVASEQYMPTVAYTGSHYVVAWQSGDDIVAARVNAEGDVVDAVPLEVSTSGTALSPPDITSGSTGALIVWADTRDGGANIHGARVAGDGTLLDPNGFAITTATTDQSQPAVAFDGTRYLVTWESSRNGFLALSGARLEADGSVVDTSHIAISSGESNRSSADVAFNGSHYVIAWLGDGIRVAHFETDGSTESADGTLLSPNVSSQSDPAVATDGMDFMVVWHAADDLYGSLVASDGTVLSVFPICTAEDRQTSAKIAFVGSHYLVAWNDFRGGIYGARVTTSGEVLDPDGFSLTDEGNGQLALGFDGSELLLVWHFNPTGYANIYGQRFTVDGVPVDAERFTISDVPAPKGSPALALGTTDYFVAWRDTRENQNGDASAKTYGTRVSRQGEVLDPGGILISETFGKNEDSQAVGFDGTNFLVLWESTATATSPTIFGSRIDPDGNILDSGGPANQPGRFSVLSELSPSRSEPALAHDGTNSVVVFAESSASTSSIRATRLDGDAAALDPGGLSISGSGAVDSSPALAVNDHGAALVAYMSSQRGNRIYANIVSLNCSLAADVDDNCDGIDDDCDGDVDEDYPSTPTTCGTAECPSAGELTCIARSIVDTCVPPLETPDGCMETPGTGGSGSGGESSSGGTGTPDDSPSDSGGAPQGDGDLGGDEIPAGDGDGDFADSSDDSNSNRDGNTDSGGCGCKVTPGPTWPMAPWASLALLSLVIVRRRAAGRPTKRHAE